MKNKLKYNVYLLVCGRCDFLNIYVYLIIISLLSAIQKMLHCNLKTKKQKDKYIINVHIYNVQLYVYKCKCHNHRVKQYIKITIIVY